MNGLLSGVSSVRGFFFGWLVPSFAFCGLLAFFVLPLFDGTFSFLDQVAEMGFAERSLALTVAALMVGLTLSAFAIPLLQLVEGYSLPTILSVVGTRRLQRRRGRLIARYDDAKARGDQRAMNEFITKRQWFPVQDADVLPTMLGNALKASETYGWDRYMFDTVTLWQRLRNVASESQLKDEEAARAMLDFFTAAFYLAVLFSASAAASWLSGAPADAWLGPCVGGVVAAVLSSRGALFASREYGEVIKAMTDQGRVPLAASLGLVLPAGLEAEREMWRAVGFIAKYPHSDKRASQIDPFRSTPDDTVAHAGVESTTFRQLLAALLSGRRHRD